MNVVVDSNVIFAGLYSSRGASRQILLDIRTGNIQPILTVGLYEEYADVIRRPPLSLGSEDSEIVLEFLCKQSKLQEVFFLWRPFLRDPHDDMLLEAAVAGSASIIITHNLKDFGGVEKFGIRALSPKQYLERRRKR